MVVLKCQWVGEQGNLESFMSWCSSINVGGPLRLVFGLVAVPGLGELLLLLLLSDVVLFLLAVVGGI